jgi:hypothetical protein
MVMNLCVVYKERNIDCNCIVVFIYLQILILQMSNNESWFRSRHFAYCLSSQVGKYKYVMIKCRVIANLKSNIML